MALNASGALSLGGPTAGESVNLELGQAAGATITMNDTNLRSLFGVASGQISMSSGYGKSSGPTVGIFGGGKVGPANSITLDGITFATSTSFGVTGSLTPLGAQSFNASCWNNSNIGIFAGTAFNPSTTTTTGCGMTVIQFATATATQSGVGTGATEAGGLLTTGSTLYPALFYNSKFKGYRQRAAGGSNAFVFDTLTDGVAATGLVQGRTFCCSTQSVDTAKGYNAGGYITGPPLPYPRFSEIDGLNFSTETTINPAVGLVQTRGEIRSSGLNSPTRGYWVGGSIGTQFVTTPLTQIDGINFSTETAIDPAAVGSLGQGIAIAPSRAIFQSPGATPNSATTTTQGFQFSTESFVTSSALLTVGRAGPQALHNGSGT